VLRALGFLFRGITSVGQLATVLLRTEKRGPTSLTLSARDDSAALLADAAWNACSFGLGVYGSPESFPVLLFRNDALQNGYCALPVEPVVDVRVRPLRHVLGSIDIIEGLAPDLRPILVEGPAPSEYYRCPRRFFVEGAPLHPGPEVVL